MRLQDGHGLRQRGRWHGQGSGAGVYYPELVYQACNQAGGRQRMTSEPSAYAYQPPWAETGDEHLSGGARGLMLGLSQINRYPSTSRHETTVLIALALSQVRQRAPTAASPALRRRWPTAAAGSGRGSTTAAGDNSGVPRRLRHRRMP